MLPSLIRNANCQWTETCSTRNKLQSLSIPPHTHPTHIDNWPVRAQGQRWRAVRKWQRSQESEAQISRRALSWPRVSGLQRQLWSRSHFLQLWSIKAKDLKEEEDQNNLLTPVDWPPVPVCLACAHQYRLLPEPLYEVSDNRFVP